MGPEGPAGGTAYGKGGTDTSVPEYQRHERSGKPETVPGTAETGSESDTAKYSTVPGTDTDVSTSDFQTFSRSSEATSFARSDEVGTPGSSGSSQRQLSDGGSTWSMATRTGTTSILRWVML